MRLPTRAWTDAPLNKKGVQGPGPGTTILQHRDRTLLPVRGKISLTVSPSLRSKVLKFPISPRKTLHKSDISHHLATFLKVFFFLSSSTTVAV